MENHYNHYQYISINSLPQPYKLTNTFINYCYGILLLIEESKMVEISYQRKCKWCPRYFIIVQTVDTIQIPILWVKVIIPGNVWGRIVAMKWMMVMIRQGIRGGAIFEYKGVGCLKRGRQLPALSLQLFTIYPFIQNFLKTI